MWIPCRSIGQVCSVWNDGCIQCQHRCGARTRAAVMIVNRYGFLSWCIGVLSYDVCQIGVDVTALLLVGNLVEVDEDARLLHVAKLAVDGRAQQQHLGRQAHVGVDQRRDVDAVLADEGVQAACSPRGSRCPQTAPSVRGHRCGCRAAGRWAPPVLPCPWSRGWGSTAACRGSRARSSGTSSSCRTCTWPWDRWWSMPPVRPTGCRVQTMPARPRASIGTRDAQTSVPARWWRAGFHSGTCRWTWTCAQWRCAAHRFPPSRPSRR